MCTCTLARWAWEVIYLYLCVQWVCTKCTAWLLVVDDEDNGGQCESTCARRSGEQGAKVASSTCHRHYHQETRGEEARGFESNSCLRLQSALVARASGHAQGTRPLTDSRSSFEPAIIAWRDRERSSPGRKICRVTSGSLSSRWSSYFRGLMGHECIESWGTMCLSILSSFFSQG